MPRREEERTQSESSDGSCRSETARRECALIGDGEAGEAAAAAEAGGGTVPAAMHSSRESHRTFTFGKTTAGAKADGKAEREGGGPTLVWISANPELIGVSIAAEILPLGSFLRHPPYHLFRFRSPCPPPSYSRATPVPVLRMRRNTSSAFLRAGTHPATNATLRLQMRQPLGSSRTRSRTTCPSWRSHTSRLLSRTRGALCVSCARRMSRSLRPCTRHLTRHAFGTPRGVNHGPPPLPLPLRVPTVSSAGMVK